VDINSIINDKIPAIIAWAPGFAVKLVLAALIYIIGRMIVRKLSGATVIGTQKIPNIDSTLAKFFGSLVAVIGLFAVIIASLSALNIPLGWIATIIGAMVVALGFANNTHDG